MAPDTGPRSTRSAHGSYRTTQRRYRALNQTASIRRGEMDRLPGFLAGGTEALEDFCAAKRRRLPSAGVGHPRVLTSAGRCSLTGSGSVLEAVGGLRVSLQAASRAATRFSPGSTLGRTGCGRRTRVVGRGLDW